jgi:hypothetical protein
MKGKIVFQYKGRIYNRPLRRGISTDRQDGKDFYVEDSIPDGYFEAEIVIRAIAPQSCNTRGDSSPLARKTHRRTLS